MNNENNGNTRNIDSVINEVMGTTTNNNSNPVEQDFSGAFGMSYQGPKPVVSQPPVENVVNQPVEPPVMNNFQTEEVPSSINTNQSVQTNPVPETPAMPEREDYTSSGTDNNAYVPNQNPPYEPPAQNTSDVNNFNNNPYISSSNNNDLNAFATNTNTVNQAETGSITSSILGNDMQNTDANQNNIYQSNTQQMPYTNENVQQPNPYMNYNAPQPSSYNQMPNQNMYGESGNYSNNTMNMNNQNPQAQYGNINTNPYNPMPNNNYNGAFGNQNLDNNQETQDQGIVQEDKIGETQEEKPEETKKKFPLSLREIILIAIAIAGVVTVVIMYGFQ